MINDAGLDQTAIDELRELGEDDLVAEIVTTYLGEARNEISSLRQAVSARDPRSLEQIAHRFKSASASVGAATVSGYAEELHYLARAGSTDGASQIVSALEAAWQLTEAELVGLQRAA